MEVAESQRSVDDYSDSGISVGGRDERSGSRSSALSDERGSTTPSSVANAHTKVWRDPALISSKQASVRHVSSIQHTGIMSNPPITSPHHLYPNPYPHTSPHPMVHTLYPSLAMHQYPPHQRHYMIPPAADPVLIERERMLMQQMREQEAREREKERERQKEREKEERERLQKEKTEQAVQQHFDESFRLAQAKQKSVWSLPGSTANVSPGNSKPVNPPPTSLTAAQRQEETEKWVLAHHNTQFSPTPHEVVRLTKSSTAPKMEPGQSMVKTERSPSSGSTLGLPKAEPSVPSFSLYGYQTPSYPAQVPYMPQEKRHSPKPPQTQPPPPQASRASPYHHYMPHPHPAAHLKPEVSHHSPKTPVITKPAGSSVPSSQVPINRYNHIQNPVPNYRHSPSPSQPPGCASVITNRPKVSSPAPRQVFGSPTPHGKTTEPLPAPMPLVVTSKAARPPAHFSGSPPPAHSSGRPMSAPSLYGTTGPPQPGIYNYGLQTQPLDLGARSDNDSPKRKSSGGGGVEDLTNKRPRVAEVSEAVLGRVSEPSPLVSGAAATITSVVNTAVTTTLTPSPERPDRPRSTASVTSSSSYPVRNFKKAWLKRHANEDSNDDVGSDSNTRTNNSTTSAVTATTTTAAAVSSSTVVVRPFASVSSNNNSVAVTTTTTAAATTKAVSSTTTTSPSSTTKELIKIRRPPKGGKGTTQPPVNGHKNSENTDESSSSGESDPKPSKKKPKKKNSKGKEPVTKKPRTQSESQSESEKESGPDESDPVKQHKGPSSKKEPGKRGRKPKEEKGGKKPRETSPDLKKPPVSLLKKTGESFFQDGPCYTVAKNLFKCRECRWTQLQRTKKKPDIFCRFYAFRRLKYHRNGQLTPAGFSDPIKDASKDDIKLWLPQPEDPPEDLSEDVAVNLLEHIGDHLCDLVEQEKEAIAMHLGENKTVAWKRAVNGVREMCDVCETTLFNVHWTCGRCGFVVCIDCYKARKEGTIKWREKDKEKDTLGWLLCTNRQQHDQDALMLTQIVAGDALNQVSKMIHQVRRERNINQYCGCKLAGSNSPPTNGISKELLKVVKQEKKETLNGAVKTEDEKSEGTETDSPLSFLAHLALSSQNKAVSNEGDCSSESDSEEGEKGDKRHSTLRELLVRKGSTNNSAANNSRNISTLDDVISCVMDQSQTSNDSSKEDADKRDVQLKHFVRRNNGHRIKGREPLPIRIMTKTESSSLYPKVPHSWLCDGKLLRLHDPRSKHNNAIFQEHWKRGQPVIASDTNKYLNRQLWTPEALSSDYGEERIDLINCLNNKIVPNQLMKKFWDGFEQVSKILKDEKGLPMLLKVKDWPPTEDFAELLPSRFNDLMEGLPVPEYTRRDGTMNLASRLPDCFVRPDLGPKMYIAYGSSLHPKKATTNLHLDISDAANVMVHVGIPKDKDAEEQMKGCLRALDEAGCDILTRRRVREKGEKVGALWHIYHPRDADKIRDLLNKVAIERGARLEPHHDPIHDQSWYLDGALRERLYKEYGVDGYAIAQCEGDSVFVPAGAPHQVRNLNNCIKVAEDFVSPENVGYCFHLTQEFRQLSDTHTNHEDKLQIKNIIYHSVKDVLSVLMRS